MLHKGRLEQEASDGETAWKAEKRNVEYRFLTLSVLMYVMGAVRKLFVGAEA